MLLGFGYPRAPDSAGALLMVGLVIANWKMHGSRAAATDFVDQWGSLPSVEGVEAVLCPPYPYLALIVGATTDLMLGAQNCAEPAEGAYTGEVSAKMLADMGCRYVIVGHSERRSFYGETDAQVATKAQRIVSAGMTAVVCIGEALADREAGAHEAVVSTQLQCSLQGVSAEGLVVAYEPVWAIGTGQTATPQQAEGMHAVIRTRLCEQYGEAGGGIPIIYGGSVKPGNAAELFCCNNIDGALVGGASLDAKSFWQIASASSVGRT